MGLKIILIFIILGVIAAVIYGKYGEQLQSFLPNIKTREVNDQIKDIIPDIPEIPKVLTQEV